MIYLIFLEDKKIVIFFFSEYVYAFIDFVKLLEIKII